MQPPLKCFPTSSGTPIILRWLNPPDLQECYSTFTLECPRETYIGHCVCVLTLKDSWGYCIQYQLVSSIEDGLTLLTCLPLALTAKQHVCVCSCVCMRDCLELTDWWILLPWLCGLKLLPPVVCHEKTMGIVLPLFARSLCTQNWTVYGMFRSSVCLALCVCVDVFLFFCELTLNWLPFWWGHFYLWGHFGWSA